MKYLILISLLILPVAFAQTTITVTVTVPTSATPLVTDWMATQCAIYNADGVTCATLQYPSAKALVQDIVQTAINNKLAGIFQWAIATGNAKVTAGVKTAISNQQSATAAIQAAQDAAAKATVAVN